MFCHPVQYYVVFKITELESVYNIKDYNIKDLSRKRNYRNLHEIQNIR